MKNRSNWLVGAALAILIAASYGPAIDGAFQFDDQTSILENEAFRSGEPASWWSYWPTRGLCYLSLGLDFQMHGLQTRGYHLTNLAIHFVASLAVFALLQLLLAAHPRATWIAAAGAALFALHPLQSQAVAYIVQRATALYACFYLLCCVFYLRARRGGRRRWGWWAAAYVSALLALSSKEAALSLPFGLLLLEALGGRGKEERWRMWWPFTPLLLVPLLLAQATGFSFGNATPTLQGETALVSRGDYALTQLEVVARYWKLALFPVGQNLDHDVAWRSSFGWGEAGFAFLHLGILASAWWLYRRGLRLSSFGLAWFYLALLPESSLYPIADPMFEHRGYLALFGLSAFACGLAARVRPGAPLRALAVVSLLLLLILGGATRRRAQLWASPRLLWEDALSKSPDKARPHMAVGWIASNEGRLQVARRHLSEAVRLDADYGMAWNNLGLVAQRMGDWVEAERCYSEALRLHPTEAVLHLNRGMARRQLGRGDEALADIRRALELEPSLRPRWEALLREIEEEAP